MTLTGGLSGLLNAAATASTPIQFSAIVAATFILEDAATVLTAMMAADGTVPLPVALLSLVVGVALGDLALYGLGRLAGKAPWACRILGLKPARTAKRWLGRELILAVWTARFLPGTRLPAYTGFGFLGLPFGRFARTVIAAVLVWTTLLFFASYLFGIAAMHSLGAWRWPVGIALSVLLLASGRLIRRRHSRRSSEHRS